MPKNFELISTATVGSGGISSFSFTSIPQTYTDLQIVLSGRSTRTGGGLVSTPAITFNSSTSGYTSRILYGDGTVGSFTLSSFSYLHGSYISSSDTTTNTFGNVSYYIPNYTASVNKTMSVDGVSEHNGSAVQAIVAGIWANTAAITSITFAMGSGEGNYVQYSTASLYGILKGSGGATVS